MTTTDKPDIGTTSAHKNRRRRPSAGESTTQPLETTPVIPTPPLVEQHTNDEDLARASGMRRSRSRSSSSSRRLGVGGAKVRRSGTSTGIKVERRRDSNNNDDEGEDRIQEEYIADPDQDEIVVRRRRSRSRTRRSTVPEPAVGDRRSSSQAGLPSRARHYREQPIGPNKSSIAHQDRPPSRQRHAFPTHLIDANAFCSPMDCALAYDDDAAGSDSPAAFLAHQVVASTKNERPPSRYMTKANRRGQSGNTSNRHRANKPESSTPKAMIESTGASVDSHSSMPSRRFAIDFGSFSCNQAHHDPKTDGFADVDESIPPPFRIEIITTESASPLSPATTSTPPTSSISLSRGICNARMPRRAASFGNNQSVRQSSTLSSASRPPKPHGSLKPSFNPLEWFGTDDQINDPDNFETVVTLSGSPQSEPGLDDDVEDEGREDDLDVDDACMQWSETEPPRTADPLKSGDQNWMIRSKNSSSNNSASLYKRTVPDYEDMDSDTAIAQTPLYEPSDDLMAFATQMTDLRLDDYSLADAVATSNGNIIHASLPNAVASINGGSGLGGTAPPLHTSLGHDFLSLFAQH